MEEKRLQAEIRRQYGAAARAARRCCPGPGSWCGETYDPAELAELPGEARAASLGCGNPTALAALNPGEVVLDLGSGGGIDVLLAARRVGPAGRVYGLDLTDEMLELAQANQARAGVDNVEWLKGDIGAIPLPGDCVDVIVSNCVINLAPDKDRVFRECFRVLKPGGRLAVADTVFEGGRPAFDPDLRQRLWTQCVSGALERREYEDRLLAAGFRDVAVTALHPVPLADTGWPPGVRLVSALVRARKPGNGQGVSAG